MRAVVQRVRRATVEVDGRQVGAIGRGLLVYLGVARDDADGDVAYVAGKIRALRLFADERGAMNRPLADAGGAVLVVSQFTLLGDCRRGRRPSYAAAADPERARALYDAVVVALREAGVEVATGEFRAMMDVASVNDGPVTILLDSRRAF